MGEVVRLPLLLPATRGDCVDGPRPCPHSGCSHHLGRMRPHWRTDALPSCTLDVADEGGRSLEDVAALVWTDWGPGGARPMVRERVRQIEERALQQVRRAFRRETPELIPEDAPGPTRAHARKKLMSVSRVQPQEPAEEEDDEAFVAGPVWDLRVEDNARRVAAAQARVWGAYERRTREQTMASEEQLQQVRGVLTKGPASKKDIGDALAWKHTKTSNVVDELVQRGEVLRSGGKRGPGVVFALSGMAPVEAPATKPVAAKPKPKKSKTPLSAPKLTVTVADVSVPPKGGFRVHLGGVAVECEDEAAVVRLAREWGR